MQDEAGGTDPKGELVLRNVAMPADTNPAGDIFGGWIMSMMDLAAGTWARGQAGGRVVTAAVSDLSFLRPVKVGDVVCCYCAPVRTGRTSLTLDVETWALRDGMRGRMKVTQARFIMVAVDAEGRPQAMERRDPADG